MAQKLCKGKVCVCVYVCVRWAGGGRVGNVGVWVRALELLEGKQGTWQRN